MPTKIKMDDHGDFVYSPDAPVDEAWAEYLRMADRLIEERHQAEENCRQSPFSAECNQRKRQLDGYLNDYTSLFKDKYDIQAVERGGRFLHVSQFFAQYHPIRYAFSVLNCSLDLTLHTIRKFKTLEELDRINSALAEDTPLQWWRNGPMGRPCYLFGQWVWELKPSEIAVSSEGLALMFCDVAEKDRHKHDRLTHDFSAGPAVATVEAVPKDVRVAVWRRDHGKCAKCGSYKQIDFEHIVPLCEGGSNASENIRLICEKCRRP